MPTAIPCTAYAGSANWPLKCQTPAGQQVNCSQVTSAQVSAGMYQRYRLGPNGEMCMGEGTIIVGDGLSVDFVHGDIQDVEIRITESIWFYVLTAAGAIAVILGMWLLTKEILK